MPHKSKNSSGGSSPKNPPGNDRHVGMDGSSSAGTAPNFPSGNKSNPAMNPNETDRHINPSGKK